MTKRELAREIGIGAVMALVWPAAFIALGLIVHLAGINVEAEIRAGIHYVKELLAS